jgi:maleylpyruvate isomerase
VSEIVLHNYFRSSASYRARIALELKGLEYGYAAHHLRRGEHQREEFLSVNPQGLVPALVWSDGTMVAQSMAIIEFLDEMVPEPPLLPADPQGRARVRMLSQMIACDIHPLNNLRVLNALEGRFGASESAISSWVAHWVHETFKPLEKMLSEHAATGTFCHGEQPGMAEVKVGGEPGRHAKRVPGDVRGVPSGFSGPAHNPSARECATRALAWPCPMAYSLFRWATRSMCLVIPDSRMICFHSAIGRPYFFSMDGK